MTINIATLKPKKPREWSIDYGQLEGFKKIITTHHGATAVEHKYDGFGAKLSTVGGVELYSLGNTRWNPACLPELAKDLRALRNIKAIGELVGKPTKKEFTHADEFSAIQRRPLTTYSLEVDELASDAPLELRLYDIFEWRGKDLMPLPLRERKRILQDVVGDLDYIKPVHLDVIDDPAELQQMLKEAFAQNLEGFVVKDLTTPYVPGKRTPDWLKLKRSATFDLLVVGLYQTPERLAQGWKCSNLLGGVLNEETGMIETFGKLTVSSAEESEHIYNKLKRQLAYTWSKERPYYWQNQRGDVKKDPSVVYNSLMTARGGKMLRKAPFMYVKNPLRNSFVVEAACMAVSSGSDTWTSCGTEDGKAYTMRQPTFERIRTDKRNDQATTTQQILTYIDC